MGRVDAQLVVHVLVMVASSAPIVLVAVPEGAIVVAIAVGAAELVVPHSASSYATAAVSVLASCLKKDLVWMVEG